MPLRDVRPPSRAGRVQGGGPLAGGTRLPVDSMLTMKRQLVYSIGPEEPDLFEA